MTDTEQQDPPAKPARHLSPMMQQASVAAVGLEFGVSIGIAAWFGSWLDGRWGTDPWLLLTGVILGSIAGFRSLFRFAKRYNEDNP